MKGFQTLSGAVALAVFCSGLVLISPQAASAAKNEGKGSGSATMEPMSDQGMQAMEKRQLEERKALEKRYKADMEALKQKQKEERNTYEKRIV